MITSPLLSNVRHRAMLTPVSLLSTRLIHISPNCCTIFYSFEIILKMGNCPWDWISNPLFCTNPLLQKTFSPIRAGATIWRTRRCLGRRAKGGAKNTIVWFRKWPVHQKGMNMMKVNETHTPSCSLWEDKGTTLFQVCCRRVNIFPIYFKFTYTRQAMSQFGINFINVTNFSNVQNLLLSGKMCWT